MAPIWNLIQVFEGKGEDIPSLIDQLTSDVVSERESAYSKLRKAIVQNDELCEGSFYIIQPLIKKMVDNPQMDFVGPLDILYEIFNGNNLKGLVLQHEDGTSERLLIACQRVLLENRIVIKDIPTKSEDEINAKNDLLRVIGVPSHFSAMVKDTEKDDKLLALYGHRVIETISKVPPSGGRELLIEMKDNGLSAEEVLSFLYKLHKVVVVDGKNENLEDALFDLCDSVVGHVAPSQRIW